jgi:hypothetical protein
VPRLEVKPVNNEDYAVAQLIINDLRNVWNERFKQASTAGMDAVKFSQLSIIALTQLGAIVAVDVGMPTDKFIAVCKAQHDEAYRRAPRFG